MDDSHKTPEELEQQRVRFREQKSVAIFLSSLAAFACLVIIFVLIMNNNG